MSVPLRYAIVGTGGIAQRHLNQVLERADIEVVGFSDPCAANLERFGAEHPKAVRHRDPRVMLAKAAPNLVSICAPNRYHCALALDALAAGAHVICEKPMAMTLAEARRMEAARRRARRHGLINFTYRNTSSFRFAREIIAAGEIGAIQRIHVVYLQSWLGGSSARFSWRNDRKIAGFGALGDLGAHMIDAARFVSGLEIRRVVGLSRTLVPNMPDAHGKPRAVTTDTNAAFLAEFEGGAIGTFETSQTTIGYGNHHRVEISGARGTIAVLTSDDKRIWMNLGDRLSHYATWTTDFPSVAVPTEFVSAQPPPSPGVLVDVLRGAKHPYPTFADGVRVQAVLAAIQRSEKSGRWTTL